ncbi:MAG: KH domain-containing protein [Patescibacteria group bacterium]
MKKLLSYIIEEITGTKDFSINEEETPSDKNSIVNLTLAIDPKYIGIIVGKEGKTIKNIKRILAVKGVLENKLVNISVKEPEP